MTADLTDPQAAVLAILYDRTRDRKDVVYPGELARLLWPDSRGWDKRSRRYATAAGGALGATMPMKAAQLLWKLHRKGYATHAWDVSRHRYSDNRWEITESGIAEHRRRTGVAS